MSSKRYVAAAALALALVQTGCKCSDEKAEAEKKAAFEDEKKPKRELATIDVYTLPESASVRDQVFNMRYADVVRRIGPHKLDVETSMRFESKLKDVKLGEKSSLEQSKGLDFHLTTENARGRGIELFFVAGEVYAGNKGGPYAKRGRAGQLARVRREAAVKTLSSMLKRYQDGLILKKKGTTTADGHSLAMFDVAMDKSKFPAPPALPEVDVDTAASMARQALSELKRGAKGTSERTVPAAISGTLGIDDRTGVVVTADLSGEMFVNSKLPVKVTWTIKQGMTNIGKAPDLKPPPVVTPERAPKHETDPIGFWTGEARKKTRGLTERPGSAAAQTPAAPPAGK